MPNGSAVPPLAKAAISAVAQTMPSAAYSERDVIIGGPGEDAQPEAA